MRSSLPVVLLFVVSALAGCLGGDDDVESSEPQIAEKADEVVTTSTTGSIKGTVASDLFEALGGATVAVVETGDETTVAKNGEFVFNDLEPGRFTLIASALGYGQGTRAVDVKAGEVSAVAFQLLPLPSDDPYIEQRDHAGIISYGAAWTAELPVIGCLFLEPNDGVVNYNPDACGQLSSAPAGATQPEFAVTEDVKTILIEMVWDPAGPLGEFLKMDLVCPLVPRGFLGQVSDEEHVCYFPTTSRDSPIVHRIDESHWIENDYNYTGTWVARVFPTYGTLGTYDLVGVDVGVTYQQQFTVYISIFHKEPAPEGYTAIPDL